MSVRHRERQICISCPHLHHCSLLGKDWRELLEEACWVVLGLDAGLHAQQRSCFSFAPHACCKNATLMLACRLVTQLCSNCMSGASASGDAGLQNERGGNNGH